MSSPSEPYDSLKEAFRAGQRLLSEGQDVEAVGEFQKLANNFPDASLALVSCLRHGVGTKVAPRRAWKVLERLVEVEYVPALLTAALWLRDDSYLTHVPDTSIVSDDPRSVSLLQRIRELEPKHRAATTALGRAMLHERGGFKEDDCGSGIDMLAGAAEMGCMEALSYLGKWMLDYRLVFYERGAVKKPSEEDIEVVREGRDLLKLAAKAGIGHAHFYLSEFYCPYRSPLMDKFGVMQNSDRDRLKTRDNYSKSAAELGYTYAYVNLAEALSTGNGHEAADFDKACSYYEAAWKCGIVNASDLCGFHYETGGEGNAPDRVDFHKAFEFYKRGYMKKDAYATCHLAECFDEGMGVERDQEKAESLLLEGHELALKSKEDLSKKNEELTGNASALETICDCLCRIYLARLFRDADKDGKTDAKLQKLVNGKRTRSEKISIPRSKQVEDSEVTVMKELKKLVGDKSAEELKLLKSA